MKRRFYFTRDATEWAMAYVLMASYGWLVYAGVTVNPIFGRPLLVVAAFMFPVWLICLYWFVGGMETARRSIRGK